MSMSDSGFQFYNLRGRFGNVKLIMSDKDFNRVSEYYFSRRRELRAGLIFSFQSLNTLLSSSWVQNFLYEDVMGITFAEDDPEVDNFAGTMEMTNNVGYKTVISFKDAPEMISEPVLKPLNKHASGLFITDRSVRPQLSKKITFVYSYDSKQLKIRLWSLYVGEDVGELKGNVSIREQVYFFERDHKVPAFQSKIRQNELVLVS